ncbi:DUF1294 domain-containing protein [Zavarzinella formosa]|uniref:DUF1294 domain-containing protein n=1 Tax=Zavarzinella formosa TaxID=360055 RepID=UPI0002FB484C|nr:DUF1294 domain-containing protein [Zavarzinella formosa]
MKSSFKPPVLVAILVVAALMTAAFLGRLPKWVVAFCLVACVVSFVMMAIDKRRAEQRQRRISERALHLIELVGGWPGSLAAQHLVRHKNRKLSYQIEFIICAAVNSTGLLWLAVG